MLDKFTALNKGDKMAVLAMVFLIVGYALYAGYKLNSSH